MKKSQIIEIIIHILLWLPWPIFLALTSENLTMGVFRTNDVNYNIALIYGTLLNILIFYILVYTILPYYFVRKKYLFGIVASLLFYFVICFIEGLTDYIVLTTIYFPTESTEISERLDGVYLTNIILNIPFIIISYTYRFTKDWYKNEKIKQKLKEEKLISELQFLKSQINPHFLFNTLNNLFGMARQIKAIPVADGIAKLSNMMRYMLYDSEVEKVSVEKEINYIKDYIDLQKLRIQSSKDINIDLQITNNSPNLKIAPLILIPFVENAFKHGISIKNKSNININLITDGCKVNFNISNTINKLRLNRNEENSGFGLNNVQKRLELIYPNKHNLDIEQINDVYTVSLTIDTQI